MPVSQRSAADSAVPTAAAVGGQVGGPVGAAVAAVLAFAATKIPGLFRQDTLGPKRRRAFREAGGIIQRGRYFFGGERIGLKGAKRIAVQGPPTADEWNRRQIEAYLPKRRRAGGPAPRPPAPPPPRPAPPPPPPPPPRPPSRGPSSRPRARMPKGFTRGSIVAYVVSQGIVWAINAAGDWLKVRYATPDEIRAGKVATPGGQTRQSNRPRPPPKKEPPPPAPAPAPAQPAPRPIITTIVLPAPVPPPLPAPPPPTPAPAAPPEPLWLKVLKGGGLASVGKLLFPDKAGQVQISKRLARSLTASNLPSVSSQSFSSFSSFGQVPGRVGTKTCECKPKRRRKPKQPRTVCYSGTFTEKANGLRKLKKRKVPCR